MLLSRHDRLTRVTRVDGHASHCSVPMESWCVTRDDLGKLRSAVHNAVQCGHIIPTDLDAFDPNDNKFGPCIHTVVSQFICPVTHIAGDQSWALMSHPEGLTCDLFVTHCWAEGVYEFIDKVLNSWPRGASHAYCCMLSNPQSLDIGALILSPSESPFARALASATHMLVVPNRCCSIYSRVWCAYEAYLAYKWQKEIYVASSPISGYWLELAVALTLYITCTVSFSIWPSPQIKYLLDWYFELDAYFDPLVDLFLCLTYLCFFLPPSFAMRLVNYSSLVLAGAITGTVLVGYSIEYLGGLEMHIWCFWLGLSFVGSEADRMHLAADISESMLLHAGFTGRVRDSQSSIERDKTSILKEISASGEELAVDTAIGVLLQEGMSTVNLRKAAANGVIVKSAGRLRILFIMSGIYVWFWNGVWGIENTGFRTLGIILCIQPCVFLVLLATLPKDSRAFASAIMFKMMVVGDEVLSFLFCPFLKLRNSLYLWSYLLSGSLALLICGIGLGRLTSLPLLGPWVARLMLAVRCHECREVCCCCFFGTKLSPRQVVGEAVAIEMMDSSQGSLQFSKLTEHV